MSSSCAKHRLQALLVQFILLRPIDAEAFQWRLALLHLLRHASEALERGVESRAGLHRQRLELANVSALDSLLEQLCVGGMVGEFTVPPVLSQGLQAGEASLRHGLDNGVGATGITNRAPRVQLELGDSNHGAFEVAEGPLHDARLAGCRANAGPRERWHGAEQARKRAGVGSFLLRRGPLPLQGLGADPQVRDDPFQEGGAALLGHEANAKDGPLRPEVGADGALQVRGEGREGGGGDGGGGPLLHKRDPAVGA